MKILVIEDEVLLADSLKALLTGNGFEVECVYNGEDGAAYAGTGIYDLLILDVMMPGLNGYEVARRVRKERCGVPILMLTAKTELEDEIEGLDAGADYYLTKPFDSRKLLACIHALLRRQGAQVNELVAGNTALNLLNATLSCKESSVRLSSKEFDVHRNPLCGRNFEYYSEDPLLSGKMAAAITRGVQSIPGTGTTVKHFACNNQEENRRGVSSVVSERALREIYLKGFEIAVKEAGPMAIMTSYNKVNGIHTANSYDLCTRVAREEWGFQGIIMTDWTTTNAGGGSSAAKYIEAGNDMIMPGNESDIREIVEAVYGTGKQYLEERCLRQCAARVIRMILSSNAYEWD